MNTVPSEKDLDHRIKEAFSDEPFRRWILTRTKFGAVDSTLVSARSDYAWSRHPFTGIDASTGSSASTIRESETDVFVVLEVGPSQTRVALHIENKLGSGSFTKDQPELSAARASHWAGKERYGSYVDWQTILMAPQRFLDSHADRAKAYDVVISHEALGEMIVNFPLT